MIECNVEAEWNPEMGKLTFKTECVKRRELSLILELAFSLGYLPT